MTRIYVWCYHCRVKEFGYTILPGSDPVIWSDVAGEVVCPKCGEVRG